MATQIIRCSCKHAYQDSLYGVGNRVGNEQRTGMIRCTVCGTVGGTKSTFVKPAAAAAAPEPVAAKPDKKGGRDNKGKDKEKKSSKDKSAPKPKVDRSRKMNKK
jgi:hypothetical protein